MLNTLVSIVNEYMGSQWALFMPTVVNSLQSILFFEASKAIIVITT